MMIDAATPETWAWPGTADSRAPLPPPTFPFTVLAPHAPHGKTEKAVARGEQPKTPLVYSYFKTTSSAPGRGTRENARPDKLGGNLLSTMKKIFFIAILAVLAIFFACNKSEQQDSVPVTPTTVEQNDDEVTSNGPQGSEVLSFRSCDGCGTCCCRVTLRAPDNAIIDTRFCSAAFPGCGSPPGCGCLIGNGTGCGPGTTSGALENGLELEEGTIDDFKEWCAGGDGSMFVIRNADPTITASYRVDCGGANPINVDLAPGDNVLISIDDNCDPTEECQY